MPGSAKSARAKRKLTHTNARGEARMVDVGAKAISARQATASGVVRMQAQTLRALTSGSAKKGDVLAVARVAGIQASKRTPELIPLCHAIQLTSCEIDFVPDTKAGALHIRASVSALDRTGAEMEALTAVAMAALTVYDMLKSIDRAMTIDNISLQNKSGGKTGPWQRPG